MDLMAGRYMVRAWRGWSMIIILSFLLGFFIFFGRGVVLAEGVGEISQGYQTSANTSAGELVSLVPNSQDTVQLANPARAPLLIGVVANKPTVTLSSGTSDVQIVTSGSTATLVSDINGVIHAGDKITASPISGIGMRATTNTEIVGTAQASFSMKGAVPFTVKNTTGQMHVVHIGLIPAEVGVVYYTGGSSTSIVPSGLQRIANAIAGRNVSVARVLISFLIVLLGFCSTAVILYASVRSGITSVGRNPLAARAIHASLFQVLLVVIAVMVAMVAGAYVVLAV